MNRRLLSSGALLALLGLAAIGGSAFAQPPDKNSGHSPKGQTHAGSPNGKKAHQNLSGKNLVGDKIKQNGNQKFHEHGKFAAFVNVSNGKIAGVSVKHSEKGDVAVTKYKTTKNMAQGPSAGFQLASYLLAQDQYVGTMWIGYAYVDDYGEEIIYWFPYDMILDGDTGAIDYYPAY